MARAKAAPERPAYCKMADAVRAGTLESSQSEAEWRALCPGSTVGSSGGVLPACDACPRSGQPARKPEDRCATCWDWEEDVEKVEVQGEYRCVDPDRCADRVVRRYLAQGGTWEFHDDIEVASLPEAQREGRCEYSGRLTRGAPFLPGNDLLLKAELLRLWTDPDRQVSLEAEAELCYRGWMDEPPSAAVAKLLTDPERAAAWMQRRLNTRFRALVARMPSDVALKEKTPKEDPGPPTEKQWEAFDKWEPKAPRKASKKR